MQIFIFTYFCGAVYDDMIYSKMALAVYSTAFIRELWRAALGLTEKTDATCIVVSEETGYISIASEGKIRRVAEDELFLELHAGTTPS